MDINLREEFDKILNDYGSKYLYVHNNQKIKCSCFNELHKAGNSKHKLCDGTGFINTTEIIKMICQGLGTTFDIGNFKPFDIGNVYQNFNVFYTDHRLCPRTKDIIIVTGFNDKGVPMDVHTIYEVTSVDEMRMDNGELIINSVLAKSRPDLNEIYQSKINNLRILKKYKGRLYLCQRQITK